MNKAASHSYLTNMMPPQDIWKKYFDISYSLDVYEEHSLSKNSSAKAMAYVGITQDDS